MHGSPHCNLPRWAARRWTSRRVRGAFGRPASSSTRSLRDDDSPRAHETMCIRRRGERIDAYVAALGWRVNETLVVDGDTDVQFLVREMHEDKIALMHFAARDRRSRAQLFVRGTRHANAGAICRIHDQSAAVEPARRITAPSIRLTEHGLGAIDHDYPRILRRARDAG